MNTGLVLDGRFLRLGTHPFKRVNPLSGGRFQTLAQRPGIVGDELGAVAGTADLDVEALLRGEMGVIRLHHGNHVVHGASLEGMNGRGPGMVEMAELRSVLAERRHPSVLEPERDSASFDRMNLGGVAVDEPETGIVPGPADAVAGAQLDRLGTVDLDGAAPAADPARLPRDRLPAPAFQHHRPGRMIDAGHAAFVALLDTEAPVVPLKSQPGVAGTKCRLRTWGRLDRNPARSPGPRRLDDCVRGAGP